jgi:hypothetical protein
MDYVGKEISQGRLAEIKARLAQPPPVRLITGGGRDKSPIASYLSLLRNDQIDLVREVERLRAAEIGRREPAHEFRSDLPVP